MVWERKCSFPRFLSFRYCLILEIKNLETESFCLLQIFYILIARLKPFIEFQINVYHQIIKTPYIKRLNLCKFLSEWRKCLFQRFFKEDRHFSIDAPHNKYILWQHGNFLNIAYFCWRKKTFIRLWKQYVT